MFSLAAGEIIEKESIEWCLRITGLTAFMRNCLAVASIRDPGPNHSAGTAPLLILNFSLGMKRGFSSHGLSSASSAISRSCSLCESSHCQVDDPETKQPMLSRY